MIKNATPETFDDYIGQIKAKETLKTVLDNIRVQIKNILETKTNNSLSEASMFMPPSIIIIGPPGYGKTQLAQIYASNIVKMAKSDKWPLWAVKRDGVKNYGRENWDGVGLPSEPYYFASIEGSNIDSVETLDHYLYYLQIQGVLFIDECQSIPSKMHEHFLRIMSEQKYQSKIANKLLDHYGFTLIGTTTHEGRIFRPFLERFRLTITMDPYTEEDISNIILHYCNKLNYKLEDEALEILINRSRDNPRNITQNLDMIFISKDGGIITKEDALKATELRGIGPYGLTNKDIQILNALNKYGTLGAEVLSEIIDAVDIKNYKIYERYLLNKEYILPTKSGRVLTKKGKEILKEFENKS